MRGVIIGAALAFIIRCRFLQGNNLTVLNTFMELTPSLLKMFEAAIGTIGHS